MNVFYTQVVTKLLFDHSKVTWTPAEMATSRPKFSNFKNAVERTFAPPCSSGLATIKFRFVNQVFGVFERSGSLAFTDTAPLEPFGLLIK